MNFNPHKELGLCMYPTGIGLWKLHIIYNTKLLNMIVQPTQKTSAIIWIKMFTCILNFKLQVFNIFYHYTVEEELRPLCAWIQLAIKVLIKKIWLKSVIFTYCIYHHKKGSFYTNNHILWLGKTKFQNKQNRAR